jgi:predicted dehydrogenase
MGEKVRVGMVGTSWYADAMHLPSLASHPQAEVVALCGRARPRAEELAAKYGIPSVYADYREMMDVRMLDAVVIAAPDDVHYPMVMAALDAGLHVVCEKPLAMDQEQARAMAERADAAGVKHMTFFTLRWLQHTQALYELVQAGYIGACRHCQISYVHGNARAGAYRWRFDGARANGILGDLGSHLIDLGRWLNGDIARVAAHLQTFVPRSMDDGTPVVPANDAALLTLEYANGAQGIIHTSGVAFLADRGLEQHIVLYGADGTLEADFQFGNFGGAAAKMALRGAQPGKPAFEAIEIPDRIWGATNRRDPMDVFNCMPAGDRYFIDCILHDRPATPSFWDGLAVQQVIDAAKESQRSGRWIAVEQQGAGGVGSGAGSRA